MPELPEVTTVIKVLKDAKVLNHVIKKVNILKPKVIKNSTTKEFINFLVGEKITDITRIGKYIIFHLTHNKC